MKKLQKLWIENGNLLVDQGLVSTEEVNTAFMSITGSIEGVSNNIQEVLAVVKQLMAQSHIIVDTINLVQAIAKDGLNANQDSAAAAEEQVATAEEVTYSFSRAGTFGR